MKGTALILLCTIAFSHTNALEVDCDCSDPGSNGTFFPHEYCDKFYVCEGGQPIEFCCAPCLRYNILKKRCVWPSDCDCGERKIPENEDCKENNGDYEYNGCCDQGECEKNSGTCPPSQNCSINSLCNPLEASDICAQSCSGCTRPAHKDCSQFNQCVNGKPVNFQCPKKLLYNCIKQICDYPENVDCGDRINPYCNDTDINDNGDCEGNDCSDQEDCDENNGNCKHNGCCDQGECEKNNGTCPPSQNCSTDSLCNPLEAWDICAQSCSGCTRPAHKDCSQFNQCVNGKPVNFQCPKKLLYNCIKQICDYPENVDCGDRINPYCNDTDINDNGDCEGNDCNDQEDCDENNGVCKHNGCCDQGECEKNNGTCPPSQNCSTDSLCNPLEAWDICAQSCSGCTRPAHKDCSQFNQCVNGKPVNFQCPKKLLYNCIKQICDYPENVDCGDRINPYCNDTDINDNGDCEGNDCNDQEDCDENNGNCKRNGCCDQGECEKNNGTCPPSQNCSTDSLCNPLEAWDICAQSCSGCTRPAHKDCSQFNQCVNGKPVNFQCPKKLLYNCIKQICDYPENVDCGDRINPYCNDTDINDNGDCEGNDCNDQEDCDENNGNCKRNGCCDQGECEKNNGTCPPSQNCSTDSLCNPLEAWDICAQSCSGCTRPAHKDCSQFNHCVNGKPVSSQCPKKLLYNCIKQICDYPENVDCGDRINPYCNDTDINDDGDCEGNNCSDQEDCDENNGDCKHNGCCDQGECEKNNGTCPPNQNCSTDSLCNPLEAWDICAQSCSGCTRPAHKDCSKYYQCTNGNPVKSQCPPMLLYNCIKQTCDYPENVDCGDRINPYCDDTDNSS